MDTWNQYAYSQIAAMARQDNVYLELLEECKVFEAKYLVLMEKLDETEREIVDSYIASCENMEFRFAQLAYCYGRLQKN